MPEPRNRNIFLALYALLFGIGTGLIVYRGPDGDASGWVDQVIWTWGAMAPLAAVSVPGAVILTEIARWVMVLAAWLENRLERSREAYRAKILEEGRAKILEEGRAKILEEGRAEILEEGRAEILEEGRAEILEEGRPRILAEADREWESWNRRREEAVARDEPFTEPPPSVSRNGHA